MIDKWMLSKTVAAKEGDNIALFGDRDSVNENIIENIKNIKNASFLVIDIGTTLYNKTIEAKKNDGYKTYYYNATDSKSDGFDVIRMIQDAGKAYELADNFYPGEELKELRKTKEGKASLKYNEYRMLFCIYWYLFCEMDENMKLEDMLHLAEKLSDTKGKKNKLSIFYDYEKKNNYYSPMTTYIKGLEELSDHELDVILMAIRAKLQEIVLPKNKNITTHGTLGIPDMLYEPTITYLCANKHYGSLIDSVVLFSTLITLERIIHDAEVHRDNNTRHTIPLYFIININDSNVSLPWKQVKDIVAYSKHIDIMKVVSLKDAYKNEVNEYWKDKFVARYNCGSWAAMDVFDINNAMLLSYKGGSRFVTYRRFFKKIEKEIANVDPREILAMTDKNVLVIKNKSALIDERI